MKAETANVVDASKSGENTVVTTPDTVSQVGESREVAGSEGSLVGAGASAVSATSNPSPTAMPGSTSATGKGKAKALPEDVPKRAAE